MGRIFFFPGTQLTEKGSFETQFTNPRGIVRTKFKHWVHGFLLCCLILMLYLIENNKLVKLILYYCVMVFFVLENAFAEITLNTIGWFFVKTQPRLSRDNKTLLIYLITF